MAELLVFSKDQISSNFYTNYSLPKIGDVVMIVKDNYSWSYNELTDPQWRIFSIPNTNISDFANLISAELNSIAPPENKSKTLQYRGFFLNQNKLTGISRDYFFDDSRKFASYEFYDRGEELLSIVTKRQPVVDPAILGSSKYIIG